MEEYMRNHAMKPFKGYYGIGPGGIFEIHTEAELKQLMKNELKSGIRK